MKRSLLTGLGLTLAAAAASAQDAPFHAAERDNIDQAGSTYADVWGMGALGIGGRFFQPQVDLVDVSNPDSISITTTYNVPSPNTGASAQDVKGGFVPLAPSTPLAFVALDSGGLDGVLIVDITNPASPLPLTTLDVTPGSYNDIHNISYNNGWMALCDSRDSDVALIDLRSYDPANAPASINTWTYELASVGFGFVHDITLTDDRLYVAEWDTFQVYDTSDLANSPPSFLGQVRGMSAHATWATDDGAFAVTTDERTGGANHLFEVIDTPFELREVDSYVYPMTGVGESFSGHNPVFNGDRVYVASYEAGVHVLQIDRTSKTWELVAMFDTSSVPATSGFAGCWGVYPLLGEETVLASDIETGLFTIDFSALQIRFTAPRPQILVPNGAETITVEIDELGFSVASTVDLMVSVEKAPFTAVPMTNTGGTTWTADLPAVGCYTRVDWYIAATDTNFETFTSPADAPASFHTSYGAFGLNPVFTDNFDTDAGWTVTNDPSLQDGAWERVVPVESGAQPGYDTEDAGSMCYITENASVGASTSSRDIDGGPTQLESPSIDFSAGDGLISYSRWSFTDNADLNDGLIVEVWDDPNSQWKQVEDVDLKAGGWIRHAFRVSDYTTPNADVRVRFSIADEPNNGVTEGGVDDFRAELFDCPAPVATVRNGSNQNFFCYNVIDPPRIGTNWVSEVNHAIHPGAVFTVIVLHAQPTQGLFIPAGEVLIDLGSQRFFQSIRGSSGFVDTHTVPVPPDTNLVGVFAASQAVILGGSPQLCNAIDLTVGT